MQIGSLGARARTVISPFDDEMSPFEAGGMAFRTGRLIEDCPYDDIARSSEWQRGWGVACERVRATRHFQKPRQ